MTEEHDVPQSTDNAEEIQPIKNEDTDKALPYQEDIDEALPENEALREDKYDRGDIEGEYEIPNEVSHPSTITSPTQEVYGIYRTRKNRKRDYSYIFVSVIHHAMTQVSLKRGPKKLK